MQALTEGRKGSGPSGWPGAGEETAWRGRLEEGTAFFAPVLLILGLALAGGGYTLPARHLAGLGIWLVVVVLLALGAANRSTFGRPFYWTSGLLLGLALWSALSSLWSGSSELSVIEADRTMVYLGTFLAAFLIAQTEQRRQRFAEGLAWAITLVALIGLASRLLPDLIVVEGGLGGGPRLRHPLGYWNANGAMFGIATAMLLWLSRRSSPPWARWTAAALVPAVLTALYFTYSRGGLLSLILACLVLLALSRDRLWLAATLAIGVIGAVPAILVARSRPGIADAVAIPEAGDQGVVVLLVLLGGIALTLLLFAGLRTLERRGGAATLRSVEVSRDPRVLRGVAVAGLVALVGLAIVFGGSAWDKFSNQDLTNLDTAFPQDPSSHFGDLGGAGRHDFYRVALDGFAEEPLSGHGAGTYEFTWERLRSIDLPLHNAHSLYFQAIDELGVLGGLLVLGLVGGVLWFGFAAWRDANGRSRELAAVLLAGMVAFAVGTGLDWFWEIAGFGVLFLMSAGVVVAMRCSQLARGPREARPGPGFGIAVGGVILAWISAIALIGPLLVQHELKASDDAYAAGDVPGAVEHAGNARSIEPWAATPYVQLGLLAQAQGDLDGARERLSEAIERQDQDWTLYYRRSQIESEAGEKAAAKRDLAKAAELNPLETCFDNGYEC